MPIILSFFGVALYSMTIGQIVPMEFADWKIARNFYDTMLFGLPLGILLTLTWTLKKVRSVRGNIAIGITTLILAVGVSYCTLSLMFQFGFGSWVDEEILYERKADPEVIISKQLWDEGAFGYGGQRTVKLTPFLGIWNFVEGVDVSRIDTSEWRLIRKEGDIKFP